VRSTEQEGYVLQRRAFGESSVTLELFTEKLGRVSAFAKGARSATRKPGAEVLAIGQQYQFALAGNAEMLQLRRFEYTHFVPMLSGAGSLSIMYVNELLLNLLPRGDRYQRLYQNYFSLISSLHCATSIAFELRCFERTLLDELGYGIDFECDTDGETIQADALYRLDAQQGFVKTPATSLHPISGETILAFQNALRAASQTAAMRNLMRQLIAFHLDGRTLKSWDLMRDLQAVKHNT
jgi:DNA repair protein RecO (recombination protein O)